ncbi:MAG: histidine phosphatase family protein [Nitrosomonadaceae bacterium]
MDLILWRHAEAEDGLPDSARELTGKGLKQARSMAAWLESRLPKDARIIVSPARRTQQTAGALCNTFETVREIGVGASARDVLVAAGWPSAEGTVVVVGHQPTLGEVAAFVLSGGRVGWSIKKGSVWWLSQKKSLGGEETVLRLVISPDML